MKQIICLLFFFLTKSLCALNCLQIDENRDSFSFQERKSALTLLEEAFKNENIDLDSIKCSTNSYTLYHIVLKENDKKIIKTVLNQKGGKTKSPEIKSMLDLSKAYSQIVKAIISDKEVEQTSNRLNQIEKSRPLLEHKLKIFTG